MNKRTGVFSTITIVSAVLGVGFVGVGCNDDDNKDCDSGVTRQFMCGPENDGTQDQACVDGTWYSTSLCTDSEGNVVDGTSTDTSCIDGDTRARVCGDKNQGLAPQECKDSTWVDTNTCFTGPDGGGFFPPDGNGGPDANHTQNNDPATCDILESSALDGGATLGPDRCYRVSGTLTANNGVVEVLENTTLFFEQNGSLIITKMGRIQAEGSEEKPVVFAGTMNERGFWTGVRVFDTANGENYLRHAVLRNAGSQEHDQWTWSTGALYVGDRKTGGGGDYSAAVDINHVIFKDNMGAGLTQPNGASNVTVANTIFENNETTINMAWGNVGGLADSLTFTGNDDEVIRINSYKEGTQGGSQTWRNYGIPYVLVQTVALVDTHVTIEPGTRLFAEKDVALYADTTGSLHAVGAADARIVFSSKNETPGAWRGIGFYSSDARNELGFIDIHYAGAVGWRSLGRSFASVGVRNSGVLRIYDANITDSVGDGISVYAESGHSAHLSGCENLSFSNIEDEHITFNETAGNASDCEL